MSTLEGRTAVVTGASAGIGAATVAALADRGMHVHALARRADRLAELAEATGCTAHQVDVRDHGALRALLGGLEVDVLVNNAGVGRGIASFVEADPADLDQTIDTNVSAVLHACHAVLPRMIERGRGHLVLLGSTAGLHALPTTVYYDAAIDDPEQRAGLQQTGISELTSGDVADAIAYAVEAPWHVNVTTIELQPTEQTYGGSRFDRFDGPAGSGS